MTERVVARRTGTRIEPVTPTAEQRQLAETLYGTYVALLDAGFTDAASLAIITATVTSVSTTVES